MLICESTIPVEMETLGQKIRRLRKAKAMSQEELASETGVSRATIQEVEGDRGRDMQGKTIRALSEALSVPLHELIGTETESPAGLTAEMIAKIAEEAAARGMTPDQFVTESLFGKSRRKK